MQRIESENCKFKAKKLYSNERLLQAYYAITKRCRGHSAQKGQKYLFIARYCFLTTTEQSTEGKFKELQKKIEKVNNEIIHVKHELK